MVYRPIQFDNFPERQLNEYTTSVSDIAPMVRQDVLLMAGEEDHVIPLKEFQKNMDGMVKARSLTGRIFIAEEQAQNHCQVGNMQLALDGILEWIAGR